MVTRRTERLVKRALLWVAVLVLLACAGGLGLSASRVYSKMVVAQADRVEAEEKRDALTARQAELSASLQALSTERGLEEEIRTRYPVVKEGEVEFVIVDKEKPVVDTATTTRESVWDAIGKWIPW